MNVVIIAAGAFPRKAYPLYLLSSADVVVCCDSALQTALRRGVRVDAAVGDMDSVAPAVLKRFDGKVVKVPEQETNDLTKALHYVLSEYPSVSDITILGATGKREAHTIGNLSLLMEYEKQYGFWARGINVQIISDWSIAFAVGDSCALSVGEGRAVSLVSCDPTLKIKSKGLEWPLDNVVFDNWWKATLNRATSDSVDLEFNHPSPLLVILD